MNQKEIKELIELLVEKDITEFEIERGDVKLHIKRADHSPQIVQMAAPAVQAVPVAPTLTTTEAAMAEPLAVCLHAAQSIFTGTAGQRSCINSRASG